MPVSVMAGLDPEETVANGSFLAVKFHPSVCDQKRLRIRRFRIPTVDTCIVQVDHPSSLESYHAPPAIAMSESNFSDSQSSAVLSVGVARLHWIGFTTFIVRAYKDIITNFVLTIAPPAVTTAIYLVVFGSLMGTWIGNIDGIRYQQYMVPGLVLLPIITASYSQAGLSFVVAKLYRIIDEHLVSPQPSWIIVVSYVAGGVMRGIIVGAAAGFVAFLFTHVAVEHVWMSIGTLMLVSLVSSVAGLVNGVLANTLEQVNWVPSFVLTPLTYLGGVFYSVTLLPTWAQKLSFADPIFYMVNLLRYSMFGVSDVHSGISVLVMLISASSMFAVAGFLIHRGIGIRE
jgi:ABC-2 type transport system permease protein